MALKSTIFKAELHVSDMDRSHYGSYNLTIARHPSETDERMMVRLLAFALLADERLSFCKGLSDEDEADLWQKDLTGAIELWVEVGLPDEKRLRRAAGRADRVVVLSYGGQAAQIWWQQNKVAFARIGNLTVLGLPEDQSQALAALASRSMNLTCTIQETQVWLNSGDQTLLLEPKALAD